MYKTELTLKIKLYILTKLINKVFLSMLYQFIYINIFIYKFIKVQYKN